MEQEAPQLYEETAVRGWLVPLLVASLLGLAIMAAIVWLGRPSSGLPASPAPAQLPALDAEAEAYLPLIEVGELSLSRWQNLIGQEVTYLDGKLWNHGPRTILALELTIEFQDQLARVVLRETLRPVGSPPDTPAARRAPPLPPQQSRPFRAGFEHIPVDWNREAPAIRISGLLLQ
jgi:hypothetical protein